MFERLGRFRHLYPPRRVRCGTAEWEYIAAGKSSECLLLLHGRSGSGEMYFEYFLDLADAFRLIAPTIPADVTTLDEVVNGFAAILDTEGVAGCNVFGHSQGGIMAIEFSERKPQLVKTLMLSSCCLPSARHARTLAKQLRILKWIPDTMLALAMRLALKQAFRKAGSHVSAEQRHVFLSQLPLDDGAKLRRQSESSAKLQEAYHRSPRTTARWPGPVLLFETGKDAFITGDEATQLRRYHPKAEIQRFEDAGHLEVVTNPSRYIECIRRFLRAN